MTVVLKKRRNQSSPLSTTEVDSNWDTIQAALNAPSANGTVTSVSAGGLSPLFTTAVATGTTTPAITFSQVSQTNNRVLAAPNGTNGVPTFRALVDGDLPIIPISKGGTGSAAPITTNRVVVSSGGVISSGSVSTTDLFYISGLSTAPEGILRKAGASLTTGAINLASADTFGINPVTKGGTGSSALPIEGQLLIGNGSGFALARITAGSGMTVTNGAGAITLASSIPTINSLVGALTIAVGTTGSNVSVNSSSTTITINIPTAAGSTLVSEGVRGVLAPADFTAFNNKIGRTFTTSNTITFSFDIFYITADVTLPVIAAGDIGKVLFIKNIAGANHRVTPNTGAVIDTNEPWITLPHVGGGNVQGAVLLQATSVTQWQVLSAFGTITYG
jgi:hypothetical protein